MANVPVPNFLMTLDDNDDIAIPTGNSRGVALAHSRVETVYWDSLHAIEAHLLK